MSLLHKLKDNGDPISVIFHSNCPDGFIAALTIWLEIGNSPQIQYLPSQRDQDPPNIIGQHVFILGISYKKKILLSMISKAKSLMIIDYDKTNWNNLVDIPNEYKIFNVEESVATLAWYYFNPEKELPLLYKYIRTKDMIDTDAFHIAFETMARDLEGKFSFGLGAKYLEDEKIPELINKGKAYLEYQECLIKKLLESVCFVPVYINKYLLVAAYVNTNILSEDISYRCMREFPFIDFCVCFSIDITNQETHFFLWSTDEREDVSLIAKYHGGNGHRNAASCKIAGLTCRLNYKHLDTNPIWCMLKNCSYKINPKDYNISLEYVQLLNAKFPDKCFQVEFCFDNETLLQ